MPPRAFSISELFLQLATLFGDRMSLYANFKPAQRDRIAEYFKEASEILTKAAQDLEERSIPYIHCEQLEGILMKLDQVLNALKARDPELDQDQLICDQISERVLMFRIAQVSPLAAEKSLERSDAGVQRNNVQELERMRRAARVFSDLGQALSSPASER